MISIEKLVEAGCHFGHRVSRWNPRMKKYIHGKRNSIHIIDLVATVRGLARAQRFLHNVVAGGHKVVLVGTKRQVKNVVMTEAQRCGMPYVSERWLGGTLTNFTTVRARLKRLLHLEDLESSGRMLELPKKAQSFLQRDLRRIRRNLDGIRDLDRLPGALVVVDARKEYIAVNEANRLGIPIVSILDTDCDPTTVDFPIPANDDAMRSVQVLMNELVDSICEGKANARELGAQELREMSPEAETITSVRHRPGGGGAGGPGGGPGRGGPGGPGRGGPQRGPGGGPAGPGGAGGGRRPPRQDQAAPAAAAPTPAPAKEPAPAAATEPTGSAPVEGESAS